MGQRDKCLSGSGGHPGHGLIVNTFRRSPVNIDDTGNRILSAAGVDKPARGSKGTRHRAGVDSSCLIAIQGMSAREGRQAVLFNTDIGHAGE